MARPTAAEARAKEQQAFDLRQAGVTFDVIAQRLNFRDRSGARKAYERALARLQDDTLAALDGDDRTLELARLDRLYAALWPKALKGEVAAVDRCLKITEARARLLGMNAPTTAAATPAPSPAPGGDPLDDLAARRAQRHAEA